MEVREGLMYLKTHQWMRDEGERVTIGITDYAQHQLKEIVFVDLPEVGDTIVAGQSFADIESAKVVSEVHSPVTAVVCEVNEALIDDPEQLNDSPYDAWLIRAEKVSEKADLLSPEAYRALLDSLES